MAAGHFRQTQASAIIEAVINIVITVICVFKFGLVGVVCGTAVAMAYRTVYFVIYLNKNILRRSIIEFIKVEIVDAITLLVMISTTSFLTLSAINYFAWVKMAVIAGIICAIECVGIQMIFNRSIIAPIMKNVLKNRGNQL